MELDDVEADAVRRLPHRLLVIVQATDSKWIVLLKIARVTSTPTHLTGGPHGGQFISLLLTVNTT
jgi:hypothetical protein